MKNFKPCITKVSYFSELLKDQTSAIFVCFNESNSAAFIQNSLEKKWIDTDKLITL